jgi:hypothetical protein
MTDRVCQTCLQPVILARTEAHGRPFLLDPEPNPDGNQAVMQPPAGPLQTRQLGKDDKPRPYETVHMPHIATCAERKPAEPAPRPLPANVVPITRVKRGTEPPDRRRT